MRVACNLIDKGEMQEACVQMMNDNPSEEIVELIEKMNIRITFANLDWFTPELVHLNFRVLPDDSDPFAVLELLNGGFVDPEYIAQLHWSIY